MSQQNTSFATWEVFIQKKQGAPHEHAGSVKASDKEMALLNARDVYGRRNEGINIWVIPAEAITASTPEDVDPRYYVPLTLLGKIYVALRLYRGAVGLIPGPVLNVLLKLREKIYALKTKPEKTEAPKEKEE